MYIWSSTSSRLYWRLFLLTKVERRKKVYMAKKEAGCAIHEERTLIMIGKNDIVTFFLNVGKTKVEIPMDKTLFEQYRRGFPKRTDAQEDRHRILMNLMRSAYLQGIEDSKK